MRVRVLLGVPTEKKERAVEKEIVKQSLREELKRVCKMLGEEPPELKVRFRSNPNLLRSQYTSGYAYVERDVISMTMGVSDQDEWLWVLYHELAHIVEWRKHRNHHHDRRFWRTAKGIYIKAGLDLSIPARREYKRGQRWFAGEVRER